MSDQSIHRKILQKYNFTPCAEADEGEGNTNATNLIAISTCICKYSVWASDLGVTNSLHPWWLGSTQWSKYFVYRHAKKI